MQTIMKYTVWNNKTGLPVVVDVDAKTAANALGMKTQTFYRAVCNQRQGKGPKKWYIEVVETRLFKCGVCGKEFIPSNSLAKYCSPKCKAFAKRKLHMLPKPAKKPKRKRMLIRMKDLDSYTPAELLNYGKIQAMEQVRMQTKGRVV